MLTERFVGRPMFPLTVAVAVIRDLTPSTERGTVQLLMTAVALIRLGLALEFTVHRTETIARQTFVKEGYAASCATGMHVT
mmetsp:Transcript_7889/g.19685  ORF Transcript_7889/g.19685 Transcript_7889/m.19685 type:complete len:81 (-) Transcript_7889:1189-1431(-)